MKNIEEQALQAVKTIATHNFIRIFEKNSRKLIFIPRM